MGTSKDSTKHPPGPPTSCWKRLTRTRPASAPLASNRLFVLRLFRALQGPNGALPRDECLLPEGPIQGFLCLGGNWKHSDLFRLPHAAALSWLTLEGEQHAFSLAVKWGFQPLNHNKQECYMFPNHLGCCNDPPAKSF